MSFIDSYKKLDKICSEIYGDSHGVSAYIDEMLNAPNGSNYVEGWNEDLKQLKHYRWIRKQIASMADANLTFASPLRNKLLRNEVYYGTR